MRTTTRIQLRREVEAGIPLSTRDAIQLLDDSARVVALEEALRAIVDWFGVYPAEGRKQAIGAAIERLYHKPYWSKDEIVREAERAVVEWERHQMTDDDTQHCPLCENYARRVVVLEAALRALVGVDQVHRYPAETCPLCIARDAARSVLGEPTRLSAFR